MAVRGPAPGRVLAALFAVAMVLAAQQENKPVQPAPPPVQPLPYSHKTHLAQGLKCKECHANPDPGDRMTFAPASKCMACHLTIAKDQPAIQKLAGYAKSKEPIPWVRVYSVAAGVYWSHRSHLEAGLKCEDCHGRVADMDVIAKWKDVTTMQGCIACHRQNKAETGCEFCHAGK
jgi:hypothetical protein